MFHYPPPKSLIPPAVRQRHRACAARHANVMDIPVTVDIGHQNAKFINPNNHNDDDDEEFITIDEYETKDVVLNEPDAPSNYPREADSPGIAEDVRRVDLDKKPRGAAAKKPSLKSKIPENFRPAGAQDFDQFTAQALKNFCKALEIDATGRRGTVQKRLVKHFEL